MYHAPPVEPDPERLSPERLRRLREGLKAAGLVLGEGDAVDRTACRVAWNVRAVRQRPVPSTSCWPCLRCSRTGNRWTTGRRAPGCAGPGALASWRWLSRETIMWIDPVARGCRSCQAHPTGPSRRDVVLGDRELGQPDDAPARAVLERFTFALHTRPRSQTRGAGIPVCPFEHSTENSGRQECLPPGSRSRRPCAIRLLAGLAFLRGRCERSGTR